MWSQPLRITTSTVVENVIASKRSSFVIMFTSGTRTWCLSRSPSSRNSGHSRPPERSWSYAESSSSISSSDALIPHSLRVCGSSALLSVPEPSRSPLLKARQSVRSKGVSFAGILLGVKFLFRTPKPALTLETRCGSNRLTSTAPVCRRQELRSDSSSIFCASFILTRWSAISLPSASATPPAVPATAPTDGISEMGSRMLLVLTPKVMAWGRPSKENSKKSSSVPTLPMTKPASSPPAQPTAAQIS
mmetsp:Transcript_23770/g.55091  ORF Transcript_23770/g.55091 Transcript_23770/m.55091 type:complete len:247 (-) Transcript_23770:751-1491(-)